MKKAVRVILAVLIALFVFGAIVKLAPSPKHKTQSSEPSEEISEELSEEPSEEISEELSEGPVTYVSDKEYSYFE